MYSKDKDLAHDKWITNNAGAIKLEFMVKGQRYYWSRIGRYDDAIAIALANKICSDIRLAIKLGQFTGVASDYVPGYRQAALDSVTPHTGVASLASVRSDVIQHPSAPPELNLKEVWERYKEAAISSIQRTTLSKWKTVDNVLSKLSTNDLQNSKSSNLANACLKHYAIGTLETVFVDLASASNYCYKNGLITKSYWSDLKDDLPTRATTQLKMIEGEDERAIVDEHGRIKCFSQDEINAILEAIKNDTYRDKDDYYGHAFYHNYVKFLALTGCRPSEALALTWRDIKLTKGRIKFDKAFVGKYLKSLKTSTDKTRKSGKSCKLARVFNANEQCVEFLSRIPQSNVVLETKFWHNATMYDEVKLGPLVFPNRSDTNKIDHHNFSQRQWTLVVNGLVADGLVREFLPPYHLRHTFITNLVRAGVDIATVAAIVGNSPEVILKNYLAPWQDDQTVIPTFDF